MAYEVVMSYHLHMPSYFLGTFTEYPLLPLIDLALFSNKYLLSSFVYASSFRLHCNTNAPCRPNGENFLLWD